MNKLLSRVDPLLTTKWLASRILTKSATPTTSLRVVDGSLRSHLPGAEEAFNEKRIPGAQFFDINECCDKNSPYPRMLPSPREFEDYVGSLGIDNKTHVVVYDCSAAGLFSAPRVWWMLRYFGHSAVSVLDGGWAKWVKDGLETSNEHRSIAPEIFKAQPNTRLLTVFEDVEKLAGENCKSLPIVDVRSPQRYASHIRGAKNVHYRLMSDADSRLPRTPDQLKQIFATNGVDISKPFVASCNSGVSACVAAFAGYLCGNEDVPVYDGSWEEWNQRAPAELTTRTQTEK